MSIVMTHIIICIAIIILIIGLIQSSMIINIFLHNKNNVRNIEWRRKNLYFHNL